MADSTPNRRVYAWKSVAAKPSDPVSIGQSTKSMSMKVKHPEPAIGLPGQKGAVGKLKGLIGCIRKDPAECKGALDTLSENRRIKYRAACDHCSATKIKCTQERPQCTRCQTLGRTCHYSRSLRAGKPPRSSQGLNKKLANAPVLPRHNAPPQPLPPLQKPDYGGWTSAAASYPTPPALAPTGDLFTLPDMGPPSTDGTPTAASPNSTDWLFDFNNCTSSMSSIPNSATPSEVQGPIYGSPFIQDDWKSPCPFGSPASFAPFDDLVHFPTLSPSPTGSDYSALEKCSRLATETLNSLYEMPRMHIDNTGARQPSVDQALGTAARAVYVLDQLISCPCTKDFYLPMIITTIATKIIAWYQAVGNIRDAHTEPQDGRPCAKEVVVEATLALGAYQLDDKVGRALKNQIVLSQLQRLDEIVSRFNAMYCGAGATTMMSEGAQMYSYLGGFVKARLQYTIQEVESRLRMGEC